MPATPNALAKCPQPLNPNPRPVKNTAIEKTATPDFRQVFAATKPVDADGAKTATPAAAPAPSAALAAPVATAAEGVKTSPVNAKAPQQAGARQTKKTSGEQPAMAPLQQNATPSAAVVSAPVKYAVVAIIAAAVPPESPDSVPPAAMPAALIETSAAKPTAAIMMHNAKQSAPEAAPVKPAEMPAAPPNTGPNVTFTATEKPVPALLASAKTAAVIRQIAIALPRNSVANASTGRALHISLTPETLGTITVKISQRASGETAVTITASQPETLAALKHDAPNLNQILTNAGIAEANRQINFQTMPVVPPQISTGLGSPGGQPAGGQFTGGQLGQGNGNGQQQQTGTGFANSKPSSTPSSTPRPISASAANTAQPRLKHARGVDVIA